jgi:hypothetical protein
MAESPLRAESGHSVSAESIAMIRRKLTELRQFKSAYFGAFFWV